MADKIYVTRKDILLSGYNGNLESVIVHNGAGVAVETQNGVFVTLGELMQVRNPREVHKATLTKAGDHKEEIYFIHNSEVMYDEKKYKLEDFRIEAGKVARAYALATGDIITLTADFFGTAPVVGDKLIAGANGLLVKADATTGAEAKIVFNVIEDSGYELHQKAKAFALKIVRK
ncbi:capsid stabilizing protein [Bacillus phage vB_BanS-Thrax4]|nr:capsid stabilizing protein [Bacillus phage vB_BanS-Thrax4]